MTPQAGMLVPEANATVYWHHCCEEDGWLGCCVMAAFTDWLEEQGWFRSGDPASPATGEADYGNLIEQFDSSAPVARWRYNQRQDAIRGYRLVLYDGRSFRATLRGDEDLNG